MSTFERIAALALLLQGFAFIGAWLYTQGKHAETARSTTHVLDKVADVVADHEARLQVVEDRTGGQRRTA